jgi:hypothetical protein
MLRQTHTRADALQRKRVNSVADEEITGLSATRPEYHPAYQKIFRGRNGVEQRKSKAARDAKRRQIV